MVDHTGHYGPCLEHQYLNILSIVLFHCLNGATAKQTWNGFCGLMGFWPAFWEKDIWTPLLTTDLLIGPHFVLHLCLFALISKSPMMMVTYEIPHNNVHACKLNVYPKIMLINWIKWEWLICLVFPEEAVFGISLLPSQNDVSTVKWDPRVFHLHISSTH